jgi:teichuronic acid biosynthesis protein TuaE
VLVLRKNIIFIFLAAAFLGVGLSYGKIYAFHLVFIISLFFFPYKKATDFFSNKPSFVFVFPAFMFLFYCLSSFWAPNLFFSIQYIGYLFFGMSIIYFPFFYVEKKEQLKKIIIVLGAFLLLELLVCLLEMYSSFRYPISPYSKLISYFGHGYKIDPNLSASIKSSILAVPTGFHWNPNNLAALLSIALPFTLLSNNKWIKYFGTFLLLIVLGATNSRAVMFSVLLMVIYLVLMEFRITKKILLALFCLGFVFILIPQNYNPFNSINRRITDSIEAVIGIVEDNKQNTNSLGVRQELVKNALDELDENLWLGIGAGNSKFIQQKKGMVAGKVTSLHNFWLEIIVDVGLPFFLIFMSWYFRLVYKLIVISDNNNDVQLIYLSKSTCVAMIGLLVSAISCSSIIYFLPFWILISIDLLLVKLSKKKDSLAT